MSSTPPPPRSRSRSPKGLINRDYATGKPVDLSKPEEKVRQETERWLIDELGYEREQLDIEFSIRAGSKRPRPDITIFRQQSRKNRNQHTDVIGFVEVKPSSMAEAEEQLMSYMAVSNSCEWGVAATADARQFYRKSSTGKFPRIPSIPIAGLSIDEISRLKKSDLKPADNLKIRFKSILYHLYSNTNIQSRTKLCNEMTKILFCKIFDESLDIQTPYFQAPSHKSTNQIKEDIEQNLWNGVLEELSRVGVFPPSEKIILESDSVSYIVGELERVSLKDTDHDAIGAAFEVFAERYFVGEKGEFFTPRIAVKNAVRMLNPNYAQTIIDPACGSGGFLIYALEHVWRRIENESPNIETAKKNAPSYIYGIDKEPDLVKVARSYMALIGDGHTNIVDADSLKPMNKWSAQSKAMMFNLDNTRKEFDFVFTNPPFGADIKVEHSYILANYELGHRWEKDKISEKWIKTDSTTPTDPQILFIELCINLLKKGGKICIVLPEGVFGNPTQGYVRQWIMENLTILAIWDCPQNLFKPFTNTKTCILFGEKLKSFGQEIMMSVIKESGHDERGAEIRTEDGVLIEDFSKAVKDWRNRPTMFGAQNWNGEVSFLLGRSMLTHDNILVPRIYKNYVDQGYETATLKKLQEQGLLTVKTVPSKVRQREYVSDGIPYVRTSDLGVMELRQTIHAVPYETYERNKNSQDLQPLDILLIKDGTYRIGESVMLLKNDLQVVVQGHFYKIRALEGLNPYYLYWALRKTHSVILDLVIVQATLSSITKNRLLDIAIPFLPQGDQKRIGNRMKIILDSRRRFLDEFSNLG